MTVEVNKAKANLDSAEKELKNMWSLNKVLTAILICDGQTILLFELLGSWVFLAAPSG